MIQVRERHVTSEEAYADVELSYGSHEIDPATAVTIASWWQAPAGVGYILAGFASGCEVDDVALLDDIAATRRKQGYPTGLAPRDRKALDMLATFVLAARTPAGEVIGHVHQWLPAGTAHVETRCECGATRIRRGVTYRVYSP